MKKYIVKSKGEYVKDFEGLIFLGNIFNNFDLVQCEEDVLELLKNHKNVLSLEENLELKSNENQNATLFPQDFSKIKINARDKNYRGNGITIAIVDSGINFEHESLQVNITNVARIQDNDVTSVGNRSDVIDLRGHGTAVASVIAARAIGENGYFGVAPDCNLIIIKATATDSGNSVTTASLATSIRWAVDNGANIINVSYEQRNYSEVVKEACSYARQNGIFVVVPTGNNGFSEMGNLNFWRDYFKPIIISSCKSRNNYNGKLFLELPIQSNDYEYRLIYYSQANSRYRLIMSDLPITIEAPNNSTSAFFSIIAGGNNEVYDYLPLGQEMDWVLNRARSSQNFIVNFTTEYSNTNPNIVFNDHQILNNLNGGIVAREIQEINIFGQHLFQNFSQVLQDYDESDPSNIIRAIFSSTGRGIDFTAPGYFNVATLDSTNQYRRASGTSFSAPYVSGIIALYMEKFPFLNLEDIYRLLVDTSLKVGDGNEQLFGNGLVVIPDLSRDYIYKVYKSGKESKLNSFIEL